TSSAPGGSQEIAAERQIMERRASPPVASEPSGLHLKKFPNLPISHTKPYNNAHPASRPRHNRCPGRLDLPSPPPLTRSRGTLPHHHGKCRRHDCPRRCQGPSPTTAPPMKKSWATLRTNSPARPSSSRFIPMTASKSPKLAGGPLHRHWPEP